ncbi:tyrosinase family protein [Aspergillus thermomutatus]|uniref:Tyrosinase copper-binding domain-containing protein n=1 Tax=Aspergillus thermomutatus TaxID=41047 RepID=A0A397H7T2_ASPTH|nr:uncharacterized protein CDV56_106764 [Aspergillus thermomutatus]RHZ58008.1 hypothetical protein CDV56_106764 [Aspergillus thermomutatus]
MIFLIFLWLLPAYAAKCTPHRRGIRREWGSLSSLERINYIEAVQCMQQLPPVLSQEVILAARNRMDDFTAVHINYTMHIHLNGALLGWHREYLWLWEQALREDCGYQGYLPYWDWTLYPDLPNSPIFDGSSTSLSGDGNPDENYCVTTGPFAYMQLNFHDDNGSFEELPVTAYDYSPRCLRRQLNSTVINTHANADVVARLLASPDISTYQERNDAPMDPTKRRNGVGVHIAGHQALGLSMHDFFASPQDPAFMLHHAMLDRVWAIWQAQEGAKQRWAVNGTMSLYNAPTTPEITLDTVFEFGVLGRPKTVRELMNPEAYDYCYAYE